MPSATTNGVVNPHGPQSLFNTPGVQPDILSTIVRPRGLEAFLYARGHVRLSQFEEPLFGTMTGQTAGSGEEATSGCDTNAPVAGNLKMCHQTWVFGEQTLLTRPIQIDRAGQLINRSEPLDLRLVNNPFADLERRGMNVSSADLFRDRLTKSIVEALIEMERRYARLIWVGNPANTSSNTGGYQEANGLERIINTGYRDAITGLTCSAADALVLSYNQAIVQNTAGNIVRTITEMYRSRADLADDVGLSGVQWAFVMRRQLFRALTEVWPCAYHTYRCYTAAPGNDASVNVDGATQMRMIQEMRDGEYLLIDGEQVPVVIDNTMAELNVGGGNFQSDLYLLPFVVPGIGETGGQALYIEHFDYGGSFGMASILPALGPRDEYRVSPDGRYAIFFPNGTSFCKQAMIRTRKRYICRTPFLAARLDDVRYAVYQHEREWQPGTSFFENGGATSFAGPTYQAPLGG